MDWSQTHLRPRSVLTRGSSISESGQTERFANLAMDGIQMYDYRSGSIHVTGLKKFCGTSRQIWARVLYQRARHQFIWARLHHKEAFVPPRCIQAEVKFVLILLRIIRFERSRVSKPKSLNECLRDRWTVAAAEQGVYLGVGVLRQDVAIRRHVFNHFVKCRALHLK